MNALSGRVVARSEVGDLNDPLGSPGGESIGVFPLRADPSRLVKLYRPEHVRHVEGGRLDRLIALPDSMRAEDAALLRSSTSWPQARVTDGAITAGVVIPAAPPHMYREIVVLPGTRRENRLLEVDLLAQPNEHLHRRGLPELGVEQRIHLATSLVAVAETLERYGLVYADWSYANAFWTPDGSWFLIDLDPCSFGPRRHVQVVNFEDPLTTEGHPVDSYTDRYRLTLLTARCVTGVRDLGPLLQALASAPSCDVGPAYAMMRDTLQTGQRTDRPSIAELLRTLRAGTAAPVSAAPIGAAVTSAYGHNIVGFKRREPARPAPNVKLVPRQMPSSSRPSAPPPLSSPPKPPQSTPPPAPATPRTTAHRTPRSAPPATVGSGTRPPTNTSQPRPARVPPSPSPDPDRVVNGLAALVMIALLCLALAWLFN